MTKFERAKGQTIEKMDRILWMLTTEVPDLSKAVMNFGLQGNCGFCKVYRDILLTNECKDCPIYKKANRVCYRQRGYAVTVNSFRSGDPDKAIPRILAIKMWLEGLEE